jgi:hypothetical protein
MAFLQADKHKDNVENVRKKADALSVVYYKDLVREKDKEILTLQKRIKRLSATELRARLTRRHGDQERQELSERIAGLAYDLDRAQAAQKELQFSSTAKEATDMALSSKHEPLQDLLEHAESDEHSDQVAEDDAEEVGSVDGEYEWDVRAGGRAEFMGSAGETSCNAPIAEDSLQGQGAHARRPLSALSSRASASRPQSATSRAVARFPSFTV